MNRTTIRGLAIGVFLLLTAGVTPVHSNERPVTGAERPQRDRSWRLRVGLLAADTTGHTGASVDPGAVDLSVGGGGGVHVNLERRVSPLLGFELGLMGMASDFHVSAGVGKALHVGTDVDMLSTGSLTLGALFHLVDDGAVDLYAGPLVAYNRYADFSVGTGLGDVDWDWHWPWNDDEGVSVRADSDSEITWGVRAGIDIFVGKKKHRWSVGGSFTYLSATYSLERRSAEGRTDIDLDPIIFGVNGGFRF